MLASFPRLVQRLCPWGTLALAAGALAWMTARGWSRAVRPTADFFDFFWAAQAIRDGTPVATSGEGGYLYPPLLATLLLPLTSLKGEHAVRVWLLLMAALTTASVWMLGRDLARKFSGTPHLTAVACSALGFLLLADNFRAEAEWANCNNLIIVLVVGAFACAGRRPALCGALLGAAAALKYTPVIFLAYFLVRRRWTEAAWMTGTLVVLLLAPALAMGWQQNLDALANASGGIAHMLGATPPNIANPNFNPIEADYSWSIPSGMARIAMHRQESRAAWVLGGSAAAVILLTLVSWAAYRRAGQAFWVRDARTDDAQRPWLVLAELTATLGLMVALSPQTTKRHFNYLLPLTAMLAAIAVMRSGPARWWSLAGIAAVWFLSAPMVNIPAVRPFIDGTWKWMGGPGMGVVLACVLLMLAAFTRPCDRSSPHARAASPQ